MSSLPDNISWSDTVSVGGGSTGGEESDRPMLQQPTLPLPPPGGGVLSPKYRLENTDQAHVFSSG